MTKDDTSTAHISINVQTHVRMAKQWTEDFSVLPSSLRGFEIAELGTQMRFKI